MARKPHKLNLWFRNQQGQDEYQGALFPSPNAFIRYGIDGRAIVEHLHTEVDTFPKLPVITTAVATSDQFFLVSGTGAVSADVTQATKGGIAMATHGADNDQTQLAAASNMRFHPKITTTSLITFSTMVNIAGTACFASAGLNENVTDPNPMGTAGEGAMFLADQAAELTATHGLDGTTWILCYKVNGADTFADSGIKIVNAADYTLQIAIGIDLKPKMYIDGVLVGTGPVLTDGDSVKGYVGIQAGAGAVKTMDVRYIAVGRAIG